MTDLVIGHRYLLFIFIIPITGKGEQYPHEFVKINTLKYI